LKIASRMTARSVTPAAAPAGQIHSRGGAGTAGDGRAAGIIGSVGGRSASMKSE
jgi:hypothetical protein